jgi:(2Fe-2S) ferredoxin
MSELNSPPRRKRIVLCMGAYCGMDNRAKRLLRQLEPHLIGQRCYKLETANCLSMCAVGPNVVIYPDNLIFNGVTEARLAEIIRDHITPCEPA